MTRLTIFSSFFIFIFSLVAAAETVAQTRKSVGGAEVTGTFRDESGSEFKIAALGKGKLRVAFSGVYPYKMANGEMMANTGEAAGEAEIVGDTAIFKPEDTEECMITLNFLRGAKLKVVQKGNDSDCGFGHNVSADGMYKKTSGAKPKFPAR